MKTKPTKNALLKKIDTLKGKVYAINEDIRAMGKNVPRSEYDALVTAIDSMEQAIKSI